MVQSKFIVGALLVFFVTSMFSSQPAFAGSATCTLINPGAACNDNNVCTSSDICVLGACVGVPNVNSCNDGDGNVCTSGICAATLCVATPNVASCNDNDGNVCTTGICAATFCVPAPNVASCDDGNECTSFDTCAATLCVGLPNVNSCNDNNDCTLGDICAATVCVGIPAQLGASCGDSGTQCTNQDTCNLVGVCIDNGVQSDGSSCGSPGDTECSNADTCFNGQCNPNNESGGITCGDAGTACTNQDTCDGSGGCSDNGFASASTSCDADGEQCTGPDTCDGSGVCLVGEVIDDIPGCFPVVGGTLIPIESTSLILAGAQSFSWMIPVVLSVLGIGLFAVSRKSE